MHHERDRSHDHHHECRQRVNQKADFKLGLTKHHPGVDGAVVTQSVEHIQEHQHRTHSRERDKCDRDHVGSASAHLTAKETRTEQARQHSAQQRSQRDG